VGADLRISSRFSTSLNLAGSKRADSQQWVANYGHFLSDTTHYTFARLAQTTVAMTARASFTVTPLLTFQFYGQPFMSAGSFSDWRELGAPRADDYDDRLHVVRRRGFASRFQREAVQLERCRALGVSAGVYALLCVAAGSGAEWTEQRVVRAAARLP
jgi:hypothetical protein